jgi:hypothetical protein
LSSTEKQQAERGQKIRSKANRNISLQPVTKAWLRPFALCQGEIWKYKEAYTNKLIRLRERAGVKSIYDGLRHSYASYRIRHLKGNLPQLPEEMGNSPREIINSYKRNVTDAEANAWFNVMPPGNYWELIYSHIQNRAGRFAVGSQNREISPLSVTRNTREFNADLEPLGDLEARGVEPLSSSLSTQTSTCLSGV